MNDANELLPTAFCVSAFLMGSQQKPFNPESNVGLSLKIIA